MIKHFCDQTGEEITGIYFRPTVAFVERNTQPTQEQFELMAQLDQLAFSSLEAMISYFSEHLLDKEGGKDATNNV